MAMMTMETIRSKSFHNLSILMLLTISLSKFERGYSWCLSSSHTLKINHHHPNPPHTPHHQNRRQQPASNLPSTPVLSSTGLHAAVINPDDFPLGKDEVAWKLEGERIIQKAAVEAGASLEQIKIRWNAGRIIVTVDGGYAHVKPRGDDDIGDEEFGDMNFAGDGGGDEGLMEESRLPDKDEGANVISIARKINGAFAEEGEESIGFRIAVHHSVEVTTPGASDELDGVMFEAYKGFDVIVEMIDTKTKKKKIIEGKLVERNGDTTIINQKGRLRKIKNYNVQSVKLPKAKREKGAR